MFEIPKKEKPNCHEGGESVYKTGWLRNHQNLSRFVEFFGGRRRGGPQGPNPSSF